jgi:predicted nucleic acid-binding Zn ribbon protein
MLAVTEKSQSPTVTVGVTDQRPCALCGAPVQDSRAEFCSPRCKQKAYRQRQLRGTLPKPEVELTHDMAVSRLAYAIKSADGLRDGLDALVRIVTDERGRLRAMPEYSRIAMLRRFADGLGLMEALR